MDDGKSKGYKDEFEKFSNKKYEPLDPDGKVSF
jgi:hypothetical protein